MWSGRAARDIVARIGLIVGIGALAGCGLQLPWVNSVPQQNCTAGRQGTLGTAGGVIVPLSVRDPTGAHKVSALYAVNGSDGSLAWSCASTTFYGWDDAQMVGGTLYTLAGTEDTKEGAVTRAHAIYAIRPSDGKQLWSYSFMAGVASPMVFERGLAFITTMTSDASGDHSDLRAITLASGALAWSASLSGQAYDALPAASNMVTLVSAGDGADLIAYHEADGARAWSVKLGSGASTSIAAFFTAGGTVYVVSDVSLMAIDGATGATRWTQPFTGELWGQPSIASGALIVSTGGSVEAFDLSSGAPRWSAPLGQRPAVWVGPGQRIFALTYSDNNTPDHLFALDPATGQTRWSQDVSKLQSLGLTPGPGGAIYLTEPTRAQLDESVIALDGSGGARWRFDGRSPYNGGDILASGANLYYIWQSPDGVDGVNQGDITYVTCLNPSDGATRWQMALPGVNGDPVKPQLAP